MSMNIYMHPRNIYKIPPDFTQLAVKYPEFREVGVLVRNSSFYYNL